jgi:protein involved in polysaccharide export with SLBB domain
LKYLPLLVLFICLNSHADTQYRLGSGDLIKIQVFGEDDLSMEVRINDQATISYPFLGQIRVLDKSVLELEADIVIGLRGDYLIQPRVTVSIEEYRPFFITGEVENPGPYPFQPGLTLRKAVTLAGGFTERASKTKIYTAQGTSENNRHSISLDDPVKPDDVITVEQSFF